MAGTVNLKTAIRSFVLDISNEFRAGINWRALIVSLALLVGAGLLAWVAGSVDPRYHSFCSRPGDIEIVIFMSGLPFFAGATLCAIGELTLWSRARRRGQRQSAPRHVRRAAVAGSVAVMLGALAVWRFSTFCP